MSKYFPQEFEQKIAGLWEKEKLFQKTYDQKGVTDENKMYLLYAFAYPSGSGLHVGHAEPQTALDILARYYRSIGKKVFFPVGWDAFGLPAENYAIKTGVPPVITTKQAIDNFSKQLKRIGISYDWASEVATCHPGYYKWTQWLFLQLYKKGLAYKKNAPVNWCPSCQTVLANEQVIMKAKRITNNPTSLKLRGVSANRSIVNTPENEAMRDMQVCERCETEVIQKDMDQWFFKITKYKDELISGLDKVDWPKATKLQQLNWIGKSEGLTSTFKVKDMNIEMSVYDSVPQTYMAQTFTIIAPEHPLVEKLVAGTKYEKEVMEFVERVKAKKRSGKFNMHTDMEGIFTGRYLEYPLAGDRTLPIWVASFAIYEYGTGIVNCSAHDPRDFIFAKKYGIELHPVMFPEDSVQAKKVRDLEFCFYKEIDGVLEEPIKFKGRKWGEVRSDIISFLEKTPYCKRDVNYKLRDWLISRQRYWGAPIPIVYDPEGKPHEVKKEHLPWLLPTDVDFKPTGESPLRLSKEFKARVEKLYGKGWTPEYDTMDTFVDSSWYYLRYADPRNEDEFAQTEHLKKWMPVDFYMIGPEHIVLHLLYSRFFTKFLRDEGYIDIDEPFMKMRHQGMILGPNHKKMSKSKGNVINPDDVISEYGADTLRMYEMFMGPIDADKPWNETSVQGVYRFLKRVWNMFTEQETSYKKQETSYKKQETNNKYQENPKAELSVILNKSIKKVGEDIPNLKFNTAIASMMELLNEWEKSCNANRETCNVEDTKKFLKILSPFAPFMTEEIWRTVFGQKQSIHLQPWPSVDSSVLKSTSVTIPVQINGKMRATIVIQSDLGEEDVVKIAIDNPNVNKYFLAGQYKKSIYVPGKIINFIV